MQGLNCLYVLPLFSSLSQIVKQSRIFAEMDLQRSRERFNCFFIVLCGLSGTHKSFFKVPFPSGSNTLKAFRMVSSASAPVFFFFFKGSNRKLVREMIVLQTLQEFKNTYFVHDSHSGISTIIWSLSLYRLIEELPEHIVPYRPIMSPTRIT